MQDIAKCCYSHCIWDTKFDACLRTICQHRANAAMGAVHVYKLGFLKHEARVCTSKSLLSRALLWFPPLKFRVCLASKLRLTYESIHCGKWPLDRGSKVQLLIPVHFCVATWFHFLFAVQVTIYFQTHLHGEESCESLHLAWDLSLCGNWWQRAEKNVMRGESVIYIQLHVNYGNYASNAIHIKYFSQPTLVTADSSWAASSACTICK